MSVRIVGQLSLVDGTSAATADEIASRLSRCAGSIAEVLHAHAGVNSPGSQGGGDLTLDLDFENDASCAAFLARSDKVPGLGLVAALSDGLQDLHPHIANTDAVVVEPLVETLGRPGLVGVKRTLLLRVHEGTPVDQQAAFERDMLAMADYVPAIRNWSFGRVRTTDPNPGPSRWTHHWEQEFESEEGLSVDYMLTPYHWGYLDGWYNPEHPECIVDIWLAHVFCPATDSVLSWSA
jgi:hypothetical protein